MDPNRNRNSVIEYYYYYYLSTNIIFMAFIFLIGLITFNKEFFVIYVLNSFQLLPFFGGIIFSKFLVT